MNIQRIVRKGGPIVLSALSCAGVVGTGVASAKATEKRLADPEPKETWKYYIPTGIIGVLTMGCIVGNHILNRKQQGILLAGQLAIAKSFADYEEAVRSRFGEEAAIEIEKTKNRAVYAQTFAGDVYLNPENMDEPMLFQEDMGGVIFESTLSKVIEAQYHLNRNFTLIGEVSLADFYDFLGLHHDQEDEDIGWCVDDDYFWVDFDNRMGRLDNGEYGCIISCLFTPERDYLDRL